MAQTYKLSILSRVLFGAVLVAVPAATVTGVILMTDDGMVPYENSELVHQYANTDISKAAGTKTKPLTFAPSYGKADGAETLVLYDDKAQNVEDAEMYAIAAGNLATHFGMTEIKTLDEYQAGDLAEYDGAIYVGTDYATEVPEALVEDVLSGETKVLWLGDNIEALASQGHTEDFAATYGWDPTATETVEDAKIDQLTYDDATLERYVVEDSVDTIEVPEITDNSLVEVVATGQQHNGEDVYPWVLRSENITHVVELPFYYIDQNDLYLIYADLYYDMLAPDTKETQRAAVRLEDVNPESSPQQLRAIADYLHSENIPFQVAVIPVMIDRTPDGDDWYGLSLQDSPEVVEALKYMQARGGTLIQHGTTHQYGAAENPYSGRTGDDYEFYAYGCSSEPRPPYDWETCSDDSWVRKKHPVPDDDIESHRERLIHGRQIMMDSGLGEPEVFETPHYTASVSANMAMAQEYDARYEQVEYYAGMLSDGTFDPEHSFSQIFPYSVRDIYGSTVYPENLQNPTEKAQNNHPARPPQEIIDRAKANLVVTESTASFYFHPFLDQELLVETVEGIKELGYEFVPVHELE